MTVYLKYGTWSGGTLTWSSSQSFAALDFDSIVNSDAIEGRDLYQIDYSNIVSTRNIYTLIISADELLDPTKWSFINSFHKAHAWKLSTNNWTSEVEVMKPKGDLPVTRLEDCKYLKEVKYVLTQKNPD